MVAPLYTTASGLLFHAGKILILTVGLPARGKTHISRALERYLRWMGVKTEVVSLGDYRRKMLGGAQKVPKDYFTEGERSPETIALRRKVSEGCEQLIWNFFNGGGQVVIYDANNGRRAQREAIAEKFHKEGIHVIYLESLCDNEEVIETNIRNVKISSPDYRGWDPDKAVQDYYTRIRDHEKHYQTVEETEWPFIKVTNVGERIEINKVEGYLQSRIVFFLMNLHNKYRTVYFARSGQSLLEHSYKADSDLSPIGWDYAEKLKDFVLERRAKILEARGLDPSQRRLIIWTSTRRRAHHTAWPFLAATQGSLNNTTAPTPAEPASTAVPEGANSYYNSTSVAPTGPPTPYPTVMIVPPPSDTLSQPSTPPPFATSQFSRSVSNNPALLPSGVKVVEKSQMLEINPGIWDGLTPASAKKYYPGDWARFVKDPYSYRVPRAESYHDLSVRLEPILIELEREKEDLLIIGHASVIRCLLAYLIGLPASEIPAIEIARGDLIEVVPTSYGVASQTHHFWDGPGRVEEESDHEEEHPEEVTAESTERRVKRVYRDVNNFYENYAEDTRGKKMHPLSELLAANGQADNGKGEMDTVTRAIDGLVIKGNEVEKGPDADEVSEVSINVESEVAPIANA